MDSIIIAGKKYHDLLKYNKKREEPRGYPDVYFDGKTWDFKKSSHCNTNSVRKLILDGRKADNVVFIIEKSEHKDMISEAITREVGNRLKTGKHKELPDVYYLWGNELCCLWNKQKGKL